MNPKTPLAIVATLVLLALPASAGAIHSPAPGTLSAIGDTNDGTIAYSQVEGELRARDLFSGATGKLSLPPGYASWNDFPIAGKGYFAGVAPSADGQSRTLFITSPTGLRSLASWPTNSGKCPRSERPLAIFPQGALIAISVITEPGSSGRNCVVNTAQTQLLKYAADGGAEPLWLPARLARGSVSVYGTRVAVSSPAAGKRRGSLAVYDFRSQKMQYEKTLGGGFTGARMVAMYGLTAFYDKGGRVAARHISTYLPTGRRIYSGRSVGLIACDERVAIVGKGSIEIRGPHGKRLYRRAYRGDYAQTTVVCSAGALHYTIWPNYPESDPDGTNPPVNGTKRSRTLDLSQFELG